MATAGTYLAMVFKDDADENKTIRLNHADPDATNQDISDLMGVIITKGTLWTAQPISKQSAQLVTTSVRDVILS